MVIVKTEDILQFIFYISFDVSILLQILFIIMN